MLHFAFRCMFFSSRSAQTDFLTLELRLIGKTRRWIFGKHCNGNSPCRQVANEKPRGNCPGARAEVAGAKLAPPVKAVVETDHDLVDLLFDACSNSSVPYIIIEKRIVDKKAEVSGTEL